MPGLDNTGPQSEGPMTGRGLGNCNPENNEGFFNRGAAMFRNRFRGNRAPGQMRGGFGRGGFGRGGFGRGGFGRGGFGRGNGFCRDPRYFGPNNFIPQSSMESAYPSKEDELNFLKNESQNLKESMKIIESRISELEQDSSSDQE